MSSFTRNVAFVLSLLLLLPAVAIVAAPPPGPTISTPSISPSSPGPNDQVTVTTTVTAGNSGVLNVTLVYTTDNWKAANTTVVASYNSTSHVATAHIPPQYNGGHVEYYIVAFDGNGNKDVNNNNGTYFSCSTHFARRHGQVQPQPHKAKHRITETTHFQPTVEIQNATLASVLTPSILIGKIGKNDQP